ncbi:MAG: hypothetical protein SNJ74_09215 [Fimbriimonadaceae bacterium]
MPIPYKIEPEVADPALAAYFGVVEDRYLFVGGLLVVDSFGQPVEFLYSSVQVPGGILWPRQTVQRAATARLFHDLADHCQPTVACVLLTGPCAEEDFVNQILKPEVPVLKIDASAGGSPTGATVLSGNPGPEVRELIQSLTDLQILAEPFARIEAALREVLPSRPVARP